jgi:hypothetical protein
MHNCKKRGRQKTPTCPERRSDQADDADRKGETRVDRKTDQKAGNWRKS